MDLFAFSRGYRRKILPWLVICSLVFQGTAYVPLLAYAQEVETANTVQEGGANESGGSSEGDSNVSAQINTQNSIQGQAQVEVDVSQGQNVDILLQLFSEINSSTESNFESHGGDDEDDAGDGKDDDENEDDGDNSAPVNEQPVINVLPPNPATISLGESYADSGATALDPEDGNLTPNIVVSGSVNTSAIGVYTITYNVSDSQGFAAIPKTRTVNVVAPKESCAAPLDVVLVIDRSGSMSDEDNDEKPLTSAKQAATVFINNLTASDKAGIVSYNNTAVLNSPLSSNFSGVKASYAGLTAIGSTNIGDAIAKAQHEIDVSGRTGAKHVIILLSDGLPNLPNGNAVQYAKDKATAAKNLGTVIYTVGLGTTLNAALLTQIASMPANYFSAPTAAELEGIYEAISVIECERLPSTISGRKLNDANENGTIDSGEQGLANWVIELAQVGGALKLHATTTGGGAYRFEDVLPGEYLLCENEQSGWNQTFPAENNGCYPITITGGMTIVDKNFLNTETDKPECRDGKDNDGDGKTDYPADSGCENGNDEEENSKPVITVIPPNPMIVTLGTPFVDPGATATDAEDGDITSQIVTAHEVNTAVVGTYLVSYAVSDSEGLAADTKTRTVKVVTACADGKDNDSDGKIDFPADLGCSDSHDNDENTKPVITVLPANPLNIIVGDVFTDPGATASDPEDGNITASIVKTGTVNTAVIGTYTITYNVSDSKGLAADTKTRTVNVHPVPKQCNDGIDNDGDGKTDYPADLGCSDPNDDDENTKPVITVSGANPYELTVGVSFTDPGATASDPEDGNITANIVVSGFINTAVIGTYTITYNVSDSEGLAADTKTRTVKVNPVQTECNDGKDNDGDGKTDYPEDSGCDNAEDNDENEKPVITVSGANPLEITLGSTFTDPGATASDPEDGNITASIVKTGTVNTAVIGTYTITYNVSDSEGLAADTKTRTVKVVTACADGIDNDGDGKIDFPADLGCDNINDNDENEKPVITVLGDDPLVVSIGSSFVDPSATATDSEDGDLTTQIVSSSTVDINVTGTYTITYNVSDSKGLAADPKTRTVKVVAACADGIDNDGDGKIDFPEDTGCNDPEDETENNAPTITLLGDVLMTLVVGTPFVDPGATAHDPEDGDLTPNIVASGAVNPQVGTYTITYTVSDSSNLAAAPKTRTVNITPGGGGGGTTPPQCSDGGDNDSDGLADYPRDPGCESSTDNDERDTGPSIALRGDNPMTITVGVSFTDPGATASDPEEGDISSRIVVSGSVNANTIGTYTLSYNVSDAQGHSAPQVNRTVNVVSGGGGGSSSLSIFNERLQLTGENTVVITWDTNLPATSRVVYGLDPVSALSTAPLYGYGLSTATATDLVTSHSMTINGLPAAATAYFRPVSSGNAQTAVGIELTRGGVLGETSCNYLRSYLRLGYQNDSVEVTKLQTFLRDEENFVNLKITGFFDIETDRAVRAFQDKYEVDVLRPWNLPENTGYVYYTTQKKINESHCKRNFPLTVAQVGEIAAFRELIARLDREGGTPVAPAPIVGTTQPKSPAIEVSMPAPIAGTPTATTSMSGRVSLSDLLATMPHVNAPMNTSQEALTGTEGEVAGISTKRGLAATIESISDRMDLSERMVYVALFLILLFLILAIILLRRYYRDGSDEMKV